MRYTVPEGTHDILPAGKDRTEWVNDIAKWHWIEGIFRATAERYGYQEVRTPAFEKPDLFRRAVGEGTDIVSKEMYDVVTNRSETRHTLRPEGTAPALRAYVQHRLYIDRPISKLYYIASIFRHERQQAGRYRQHHQFGIEALGAAGPDVDAEVIGLAMALFRALGIERLTLKLNSVGTIESRARYVEALRAFAEPFVGQMSEDNQRRFRENALRMLDSKHTRDQELLADAPLLSDYLDDASREHFDLLQAYLTDLGVNFEIDPRLVRGFDYYTRTAFEVQSPDVGAQSSLAGGGRYDRLVADLGGPPTPGIGFGMGIERTLIALQNARVPVPNAPGLDVFLCPLGDNARRACVRLLSELRGAGVGADMDYTGRKMKAMLEGAEAANARFAVVIGDDEVAASTAVLRQMPTRDEREAAASENRKLPPAPTQTVAQAELAQLLRQP